jgi:hypothetical protein
MKKISVISLLLLALAAVVQSQAIPPKTVPMGTVPQETIAAMDRIDQAFDLNLKGWTRERTTPFQPSSGVQERWQTSGRWVRVFIAKLSPATAELYKQKASGEPLDGICDEARVFGYNGNVSCRHGEFGVSISSDVHLNLLSEGASRVDQEEAKATSRLIACFVNLALDGKLSKNWPHRQKPIIERPCERELMFKGLIGDEIMKQYTGDRW